MNKIIQWIEDNKQLGKIISFRKNGEICWSSIGIQKWNNKIKVYIDEILESQMNQENYLREEIMIFDKIEEALKYILNSTKLNPKELTPCKGQKIFNLDFE